MTCVRIKSNPKENPNDQSETNYIELFTEFSRIQDGSENESDQEKIINFLINFKLDKLHHLDFSINSKDILKCTNIALNKICSMKKIVIRLNDWSCIMELIYCLLKMLLEKLDINYLVPRFAETCLTCLYVLIKQNKIRECYEDEWIDIIKLYYDKMSGKMKLMSSLCLCHLKNNDKNFCEELICFYENLTMGNQINIFSVRKHHLINMIGFLKDQNGSKIDPKLKIKLRDLLYGKEEKEIDCSVNLNIASLKQFIEFEPKDSLRVDFIYQFKYMNSNRLLKDYLITENNDCVIYYVIVKKLPQHETTTNETSNGQLCITSKIEDSNEPIFLRRYTIKNHAVPKGVILDIISYCALKNCSSIVQLNGYYEQNLQNERVIYIAMEYMQHGSLACYFKKHGETLNWKKTRIAIIQILEVVVYMHSKDILHRNIRCESIFLCDDPTKLDDDFKVKLSNFSVSKHVTGYDSKRMLDGFILSQPLKNNHFLAPEVLKNNLYGLPADIWSVGATIFEMITGHLPFENMPFIEAKNMILRNELPFNKIKCVDKRRIIPIVRQCMDFNPKNRPTAQKLLDDISLF